MFAQFKEHYWKVSMQEEQRKDVTGSRIFFSGQGAASGLLRGLPRGFQKRLISNPYETVQNIKNHIKIDTAKSTILKKCSKGKIHVLLLQVYDKVSRQGRERSRAKADKIL